MDQQFLELANAVANFQAEPTPCPWTGKPFRDTAGQKNDTFILEGTVGSYTEQFVLMSESAYNTGGSGTRIIRHRDLVEPVGRDADETAKQIDDYQDAVGIMIMATRSLRSGDLQTARSQIQNALHELRNYGDSEELAVALSTSSAVSEQLGDSVKAEQQLEEAVAVSKRLHGETHINTAKRYAQLGTHLQAAGKREEAVERFTEALFVATMEVGRGRLNGAVAEILVSGNAGKGMALAELGKREQASKAYHEAIQNAQTFYGPHHPIVQHIEQDFRRRCGT